MNKYSPLVENINGPYFKVSKLNMSKQLFENIDGLVFKNIISYLSFIEVDKFHQLFSKCLFQNNFLGLSLLSKEILKDIDFIFSSLLLPDNKKSFKITNRPSVILIKSRPNFYNFLAYPEKRLLSYTSCDTNGKELLNELYEHPVFAVHYKGIRRGNSYFSTDIKSYHVNKLFIWPIQLLTYFKMKSYTTFDKLIDKYAERAFIPVSWLKFEISDRIYNNLIKEKPIQTKKIIESKNSLFTLGMESIINKNNNENKENEIIDIMNDVCIDVHLTCKNNEFFLSVNDYRKIKFYEDNSNENFGFFDFDNCDYQFSSEADHEDLGLPLNPKYSGWLFKTKNIKLNEIFNKIYKSIYGLEYDENFQLLHFKCNKKSLNLDDKILNSISKVTNESLESFNKLPIHCIELHDISSILEDII